MWRLRYQKLNKEKSEITELTNIKKQIPPLQTSLTLTSHRHTIIRTNPNPPNPVPHPTKTPLTHNIILKHLQ